MSLLRNNPSSGSAARRRASDPDATGDLSRARLRAADTGFGARPRPRAGFSAAAPAAAAAAAAGPSFRSRGGRREAAGEPLRSTGRQRPDAARGGRTSARDEAARDGSPARSRSSARARAGRGADLMRYAADNSVVRAIHGFTTGPYRWAFYLAVCAAVVLGVYFPVRDLYVAYRTGDILERQLAIREQYNESLQDDVDKLLSVEGIEETAREELGLVMPGEQAIDVIGLDDDASDADAGKSSGDAEGEGSDAGADDAADADASDADASDAGTDPADAVDNGTPSSDTSQEPTTSAEVEAAEKAAAAEAPWYIKALDVLFFFDGAAGQKVVSTGQ